MSRRNFDIRAIRRMARHLRPRLLLEFPAGASISEKNWPTAEWFCAMIPRTERI
jgi:hypothetical protein